jgi:hypothetical protein
MQTITLGSLPLDSGDYRLLAIDFNAPPTEIHEVTAALADKNIQADVRTSAYRDIVLSLAVTGSTKQAVVQNLNTLATEIGKSANTLTVLPDGQTSDKTLKFTIAKNPEPEFSFDQAFEAGNVTHVTFVLKAEPYAYRSVAPSAVRTPASGTTLTPALFTHTNLGDRHCPVDLLAETSVECGKLYLALADPSASADWYFQQFPTAGSGSNSWVYESGYFTVASTDAGAWDGTALKYDPPDLTARAATWQLHDSLPNGRYRVLLRARVTGSTCTLEVKDGTQSSLSTAPAVLTRMFSNTSYELLDLGELDIPQRAPRPGASAPRKLAFVVSMADAAQSAYLDAVVLVPTASLVKFTPSDGSTIAQYFQVADNGTVYRDSYSSFHGVTGQSLRLPPGAQKILAVASTAAASATRPGVAITMNHAPRYVLWRSS